VAGNDDGAGAFTAFLGSRPNLVGLAALLVVFLAVVMVSQSPAAAVLAALLGYGAGYFLTPASRRTYASGIPVHGASREEMSSQLAEVQQQVRTHRAKLPPESDRDLSLLGLHLEEMIGRWDEVKKVPEQRMALESIVYQYLPTTLEVFLKLPDSAKPAAAPEWTRQLHLLATAVARNRGAVLRNDLESMRTNGRLLEQKFEDGDLRMFRENGL
jgi:hypothetical protein